MGNRFMNSIIGILVAATILTLAAILVMAHPASIWQACGIAAAFATLLAVCIITAVFISRTDSPIPFSVRFALACIPCIGAIGALTYAMTLNGDQTAHVAAIAAVVFGTPAILALIAQGICALRDRIA